MFQLSLGPGLRCAPGTLSGPSHATADFDKGIASGVSQLVVAKETKSGTPMSIVELSVKCKNLVDRDVTSRSDPMCVFYRSEGNNNGPWKVVGRSERVMNTLNPEFLTKFKVNYLFEQVQYVKFEVYDVDNDHAKYSMHDFLGSCVMTVGEIVGGFGSTVHKQLTMDENWPFKNHGSIIVAAHEMAEKSEPVLLQFRAKNLDRKDFLGKSDPFFQFYRVNDDTSRTLLHRSEVVEEELNPIWKPFKVQMTHIADNKKRILEVVCLDYDQDGRHDIIGSFQTTYEQLNCGPGKQNTYEAINGKKTGKKGYKNSGTFELTRITNIFPTYSFLDYIRGGTQIHFTVAIDFSHSRNSRDEVVNPHRLRPRDNEYYMALKAVGEIVQDYDSDKMFPALACGAKIPPHMHESHDFSLNFQHDSQCRGVEGLLEAYQKAADVVEPASTARFSNIITQVSKTAHFSASSKAGVDYFILLILTSGAIIDIRQTITAIIDASSLPLSIIIVGVGRNNFDTMERLDADRKRLSIDKKKAERDIVQFVRFDQIKKKNLSSAEAVQAKLAREVLREVPKQLTSWMSKNHISPRSPVQVDGEQLPAQPASVETSSASGVDQSMNPRKSSRETPRNEAKERVYSNANYNALPEDDRHHHHNVSYNAYRTHDGDGSRVHSSSVVDANATPMYRAPEDRRSQDYSKHARGSAPTHPDYRYREDYRSPAHSSSTRDARIFNTARPSAPPEERSVDHKPPTSVPPTSMAAFHFPPDGHQRSSASSYSPHSPSPAGPVPGGQAASASDWGARVAAEEMARYSLHDKAVSSSGRLSDPFSGSSSTMMHFHAPAHYGTPPVSRAADFVNRQYDTTTSHHHRSQSARDYHHRHNPRDPYSGHYY
uniref:Copine-3 n=1 Tax=Plectus sambesii TaxID=2011161 RepID=A0A914WKY8_9BILA